MNAGVPSRVLLAALLFFGACGSDLQAATTSLEYDVKAAFLLNFTKFVEWPPSAFAAADSPLTICIVGSDPFGRSIDQIVEGESVNGHKLVVERRQADQQKSCRVVYFANREAAMDVPGAGVLTVGEGPEFIRQGGIIAFVIDNHRVRFDVGLKAASNAGLKLSSKLLSVARSVER